MIRRRLTTNLRKLILLFFGFYLGVNCTFAQQESLVLQPTKATNKGEVSHKRTRSSIPLPFFDDFVYQPGRPNPAFWEQTTNAITSYGSAINPPTVGVLCFDAANAQGVLYTDRGNSAFAADTLTSLPINLETLQISDSIYLSFLLQPGGYGDAPSPQDTISVDFLWQDKWIRIYDAVYSAKRAEITQHFHDIDNWSSKLTIQNAKAQQTFLPVHIPIRSGRFLNSQFKFRICNRASLRISNDMPASASNGSIWNIDRVYLNANRRFNDQYIQDVGMVDLPSSPFRDFSAVPSAVYRDFLEKRNKGVYDSIRMTYRNFSGTERMVGRFYLIEDLISNSRKRVLGGTDRIVPDVNEHFSRTYQYDYEALAGEEIRLRYTAMLRTNDLPVFKWNDTVRRELSFTDEYAYDWGIPSIGYGIIGVGAEHAKVAMRFAPLKPTTVQAVRIWFNQIAKPESRANFNLCIWTEKNGQPDQLVLKQSIAPPRKTEELGKFYEFKLETPLFFEDAFYVGWQQTVADMMNVGYDIRTDIRPKIFYNTTGTWETSKYEGAIMLRIACGGTGEPIPPNPQVTPVEKTLDFACTLSPNPAHNYVRIECENQSATASIYNISGQKCRDGLSIKNPIPLDGLQSGIYLVKVQTRDGKRSKILKLIVQ